MRVIHGVKIDLSIPEYLKESLKPTREQVIMCIVLVALGMIQLSSYCIFPLSQKFLKIARVSSLLCISYLLFSQVLKSAQAWTNYHTPVNTPRRMGAFQGASNSEFKKAVTRVRANSLVQNLFECS